MAPEKDKTPKSRVAVRLKEAVGAAKARNRSADLVKLKEQYLAFTKKLKNLVAVLKNHHQHMMELTKTRLAVAQEVAKLAERSPIHECTSDLPSPDRPPEQVCSYISIHTKVADKAKAYLSKYAQFVVEYVIEWEKVVTGRISTGLKKAEQLRIDLDHYQQKVESLRLSANQSMARGKMVASKSAEKLSRNEEKFMKSKQEYDVFATELCILIEEVTERSWRDLHPLLIKMAQFDITMSDDESKMMGQLNQVEKELKEVAKKNGLSPQPRLKEIENQKPELLSTRGADGDLRIEAGASSNGSVFGSTAAPPGSVSPQGLGGFPVVLTDDDFIVVSTKGPSRTKSFDSTASGPGSFPVHVASTQRSMRAAPGAPSTYDILKMSSAAAPPPTMEQVSDAYAFNPSVGLPPLAPSSGGFASSGGGGGRDTDSAYGGSAYGGSAYGGSTHSRGGFNDNLSTYSGASAPAPAAPPPPPPMPPPPPPMANPMSMYPQSNPPPAQQPWNSYPQQQSYPPQSGAPNPYGAPPLPYAMPPPQQPNYGQPPTYGMPQQPLYGQPPAPYGGAPLQSTNPFDD